MTGDMYIGADVFASDGRKIGLLHEVRGKDYFRITPAEEIAPYWLRSDAIAESSPAGVHLSFASNEVDAHMLRDSEVEAA